MTRGATVGIDLGTTNSVVAHADSGGIHVLPNASGHETTPSVVAVTDDGAVVGRPAANQAVQYPDRTVFSVKRRMGDTENAIRLGGTDYRPEEISALVLEKLVADAEAALDRPVTSAVITVPAYFNHRQREATKRAGVLAGLEVERLLNEPTAACLAHGLTDRDERLVFVYDLGGGTFDVSLVRVDDGLFEVVATDGETDLGGDDWDAKIVAGLRNHVRSETGVDVADDNQVMQRLWDAAQQAKHELTTRERTTIRLPYLLSGDRTYDLEKRLTREQFESMTDDLLERTVSLCESLLAEAGVSTGDVDEVVCVGGATRMPMIADRLESLFGRRPVAGTDPDKTVAIGAAAQAGVMQEALPAPVATDASVPANRTSGVDLVPAEDDGHAPAAHPLDDVVLLDVTAKTLGVETHRDGEPGYFSRHIERNTAVPATATDTYTTLHDGQTAVTFPVYQGESSVAAENELLDEFVIRGIPPAPAGEVEIEVRFELDRDGVLTVSAENAESGAAESVTIDSGIEFTDDELSKMRANLPEVRE